VGKPPPWDLYPQVVQTLREDRAEAVCLVPVWPRKPWYAELMGMKVNEVTYHPGTHLFTLDGRSQAHTVWGVKAVHVRGGGGPLQHPQR
jgi:hypothetical protein